MHAEGKKQQSKALDKLVESLNEDPKVKTVCNDAPLKECTVKDWIDRQASEIKNEAERKINSKLLLIAEKLFLEVRLTGRKIGCKLSPDLQNCVTG